MVKRRYLFFLIGVIAVLVIGTRLVAQSSVTRFAAIGDFGDGSEAEGAVAELIESWDVDFVITLGDNRYDQTTFDEVIGRFYCPFLTDVNGDEACPNGDSRTNAFFPSLGNHDYNDGAGLDEYLDYFTLPGENVQTSGTGNERYYDFVQGDIHFFVLDSEGALLSESDFVNQQRWLQAQLPASTSAWQIVYLHHPPYSSSAQHGSDTRLQWAFGDWGADAVLAAHDHTYERILRDGIVYFVNGLGGRSIYETGRPTAGSQVLYNGDYGAMRVEATSSQMTFQFVAIDGTIVDQYVLLPLERISVAVSDSADDAEEQRESGEMYLTSSDLELVDDPELQGGQTVGVRFQNVAVPQGAKVVAAYLEFVVDEVYGDEAQLIVHGEAAGNAEPFSTQAYNLSDRPNTVASVIWYDVPAWGIVGETVQTPSLVGIVQEVVDRPNWEAGNALVFKLTGMGTRSAEAFDGSAAPRLVVSYLSDHAVQPK